MPFDLRPCCNLTEIWRPVVGWEDSYEVSSHGRVARTKVYRNRKVGILSPNIGGAGYPRARLCRPNQQVTASVHVLVAEAFLGPRNGVVNHKDADKTHNCVDNLEWTTYGGNLQHAHDTGQRTGNIGERHPLAKLTPASIEIIRERAAQGISQRLIGLEFGVGQGAISRVLSGQRWPHLKVGW